MKTVRAATVIRVTFERDEVDDLGALGMDHHDESCIQAASDGGFLAEMADYLIDTEKMEVTRFLSREQLETLERILRPEKDPVVQKPLRAAVANLLQTMDRLDAVLAQQPL